MNAEFKKAWAFHDRPEALELRNQIVKSVLGLVEKSAGPLFAASEFMTINAGFVGCIADAPWKRIMETAATAAKECPCKTCLMVNKLMATLDEIRTATRANELTTAADIK